MGLVYFVFVRRSCDRPFLHRFSWFSSVFSKCWDGSKAQSCYCVLLMQPSSLKCTKIKFPCCQSYQNLFPPTQIIRRYYFRKSKSLGLCLKPVLLTIITFSSSRCTYQNNDRAKPWKLLTIGCSFSHPKMRCPHAVEGPDETLRAFTSWSEQLGTPACCHVIVDTVSASADRLRLNLIQERSRGNERMTYITRRETEPLSLMRLR
jgi:hypothetical protein